MWKYLNKGISTPLAITIILVLAVLFGGSIYLQSKEMKDIKIELPEISFPQRETPEEKKEAEEEEVEEEKPKVAIIIDDLGNNFETDKLISDIDSSLSLAILPHRENTISTAEYFSDLNRFQLMLHLPLEPINPEDAEEDMIMVDMSDSEIELALESYLDQLGSYIEGVNNHKGSKYTANGEKMRVLLEKIKDSNLFFVDSFTYKDSVAYEAAKEIGVKTGKRDVFLDNINDESEIKKKLDELIELAKEEGSAIAIGHSKPITISVLKEQIPKFEEEGIEFVKVSEILE